MRHLGFLAVLVLSSPLGASERVVVRETDDGAFVASLDAAREFTIDEAQQLLLPAASGACKGILPVFGRYNFGASKPASAKSSVATTFEFHQTFSCIEQAPVPPRASPTVLSTEESSQLAPFVQRETENAIAASDAAAQRAFHSRWDPATRSMLPLAEWLQQQGNLHQRAGPINGRPLLKVTVYTDPPNSPGPGTYVAVDFQARYERAPYRCGYVMWLRDQAGNISVLRFEDGLIARSEVEAMTAEELARTKQQFRCFAP